MAAVDPNGEETYWFDGSPFKGLNNTSLTSGEETYWFDGSPFKYLFPAGAPVTPNKGIFFGYMLDF